MYNNKLEKGFLDKEKLLMYVTQEEIFSLVFEELPEPMVKVTSPFRKDTHAGCWFEYDDKNTLRFVDYANNRKYRGVNLSYMDCFNAVMLYFGLGNFYQTLKYISDIFKYRIQNRIKNNVIVQKEKSLVKKEPVEILIQTRDFTIDDRDYWTPYGITKEQLIEDKVFAIQRYVLLNTRKGLVDIYPHDICYAFTDFEDNKKKIYRPLSDKKRFITSCKADDIGQINSLSYEDNLLVITKSYKDCRVLRNLGYESIWFQNEGMLPSDRVLYPLFTSSYTKIIIFFDSDEAGIMAAEKLVEYLKFYVINVESYHLPTNLLSLKVKDISDFYKKCGKKETIQILKNNLK